jgi:hypothetical protein
LPGGFPEPNQLTGGENCVVANYTQRYGVPVAYGWSDVNCGQGYHFMCKINKPGPSSISYVNTTTRNQYTLNTARMNFSSAEAACNLQGGHLVSYNTVDEQLEVENFFVRSGLLFPTCHRAYWMGLAAETWPQFAYLEPTAPDMEAEDTYRNWGKFIPANFPPEPNQLFGDENCVAANYTELNKAAWGWSDEVCEMELTSICQIPREWCSLLLLVCCTTCCTAAYITTCLTVCF